MNSTIDANAGRGYLDRFVRDFLSLRRMDCMEMMAEYPDKHFDLAIVDPPYGINVGDNKAGMGRRKGDAHASYKMGDWDSMPPPMEYFAEIRRVSKNQIVWGANHFIEMMPMNSPCWLIWDKKFSNDVSFAAAELAWTSFKSTAKKFECHPVQDGRIHPTQKPVKLYSWLLANYAEPGQTILDTHLGSGSIAIACHYARHHLTACEIDKDYFEAACARIERETLQESFIFPIEVGTSIARRPPRRSWRAELPHQAPRRTRIQSYVSPWFIVSFHHADFASRYKSFHCFSTTLAYGICHCFQRVVNCAHVIERR